MKFKNRIRGYAELPGSRIIPAPLNFRTHGEGQRDVLRGLLADIGIAGAVLVWVPDDEARASLSKVKPGDAAAFYKWLAGYDGDFQLYDGHLRAEEIRDQGIPALITDLNRTEAAEALGTYDAVSDLAGFDRERFLALAGEFNSTNAAVQTLVSDLADMDARMRDAAGGGSGDDGDAVDPAAGQKSLDDLQSEFGADTDEALFWPEIRVKVPKDVLARWEESIALYDGKPHERIATMLDALSAAAP